jgi:hypothetical protein
MGDTNVGQESAEALRDVAVDPARAHRVVTVNNLAAGAPRRFPDTLSHRAQRRSLGRGGRGALDTTQDERRSVEPSRARATPCTRPQLVRPALQRGLRSHPTVPHCAAKRPVWHRRSIGCSVHREDCGADAWWMKAISDRGSRCFSGGVLNLQMSRAGSDCRTIVSV